MYIQIWYWAIILEKTNLNRELNNDFNGHLQPLMNDIKYAFLEVRKERTREHTP